MDITMMGSINAYTKNLKMQTQWDQKKKSGNVTSHASSAADWIKDREKSSASEQEDDGKKLKTIMQKVYTGGKLTKEEKAYLQEKDPVTYQKLQSIEREQRSYEQELKKCRTREDVQRLKLSRVSSSLSTAKAIENNPHISDDKKQTLIGLEARRCQKLEASTQAFVKRGEYGRLPTEAERAKAEKELREAEEARRHPEQAEHTPEAERPDPQKAQEQTGPDRIAKPAKPETANRAAARQELKREEKPRTTEPDSQEIRKVRRAKARAAYAKAEEHPQEFPDTLNVKT